MLMVFTDRSFCMKKQVILFSLAVAGISLLNGCVSVGPDYEAPEVETPDAWHEAVMSDFESGQSSLQTWWTVFDDAILNGLIERVSTNNLSLKTAAARIEQAAALRGVSASQFYPSIFADASASGVQTADRNTPTGADRQGELYGAGLSMAWELDLWGRIRRSVESADASLQASVENYRDIMVLLYAEVAATYIEVRATQTRLAIAEENLAAQSETMALTKNRYESGLVPILDVRQAELNRSRTESLIPPLRQKLTESINRLSVLAGEMPYALQQELSTSAPIPSAPPSVVAGLPAELLRQRPDIRRAERDLAAQHALIGATKAELYPTLSLPGALVLESPTGSDLFDSGNVAYSFGPQVRWNIFSGGRIRNSVRAEEAGTRALLHTYEQTVLLALEEVEDSMSAYANEKDRIQSLETAAVAAQQSVELVTELYKSGLTDFQNVLNMEQAMLTQQDALATSRGLVSAYLVAVYRSLGGGWEADGM
jgi:NodT family efflux transporter outer membrane factor (OMF) lipoprotein